MHPPRDSGFSSQSGHAGHGPDVLRRLWDAFALSDEQLAGVLGGRVHPAAGQWLARATKTALDVTMVRPDLQA